MIRSPPRTVSSSLQFIDRSLAEEHAAPLARSQAERATLRRSRRAIVRIIMRGDRIRQTRNEECHRPRMSDLDPRVARMRVTRHPAGESSDKSAIARTPPVPLLSGHE